MTHETGLPENSSILQREWWTFLAALMFYTRIPVPANTPHSQYLLDRSRRYFPAIGLIVGSLGALVLVFLSLLFPIELAILISFAATIWLTGAFHEDGFADSCDGFGGGWTKEQVLTIMKDSRVGTYAVVGLVLLLAIKYTALLSHYQNGLFALCLIHVAAHVLSRVCSSLVVDRYEYVQDIDASKSKPMTERRLSLADHALGITLYLLAILMIGMTLNFTAACSGLVLAAICTLAMAEYSKKRIGGYTGDVLGAIQQLSEVGFYLGVLAMSGS